MMKNPGSCCPQPTWGVMLGVAGTRTDMSLVQRIKYLGGGGGGDNTRKIKTKKLYICICQTLCNYDIQTSVIMTYVTTLA
jgi:hypothetical protein